MKSLTKSEFVALLKTAKVKTRCQVDGTNWSGDDDEPQMTYGYIWKELSLAGMEITREYDYEHPQWKPSQVEVTDSEHTPRIQHQEFIVVDDDDEELCADDVVEIVMEHIDMESLALSVLGEDEQEEIDLEEDIGMNTIVVERDNDRDIKFTGERIASVSSSANNARSDYSGTRGCWATLNLYQTKGGKFVCERIDFTLWQGQKDRSSGAVCDTEDEVVDFFGDDWLAKELYAIADIDAAIDVE